jgi:hypothetical protein
MVSIAIRAVEVWMFVALGFRETSVNFTDKCTAEGFCHRPLAHNAWRDAHE